MSQGARAVLCCLFVLALSAPAALAHAPAGEPGGAVPDRVQEALGPDVRVIDEGLYEVDIRRGPDVVTHGPDLRSELGGVAATAAGFDLGDPERPPVCSTGYYQHILYAHLAGTNRYTELKDDIQAAMRRTNAVLNGASLASGSRTADYKVLCDSAGQIKVDQVTTPGADFSSVVGAARAAGFNNSNADYTIFYDGSLNGYCGIGTYRDDQSLRADNRNNEGGGYAVAYRSCWYGTTPMHENGHNQGAVQYGAPYSSGEAHCYDERDVMCYNDGGLLIPLTGLLSRCGLSERFDCGYDTYFDSAPESGEYLATHWNLGSPLNRFIAFNGASPPPPPPPPPPPTPTSPLITLSNRVAVTARSTVIGGWRYFKLRVPTGQRRLAFMVDGPYCSVASCPAGLDLYVTKSGWPSLTNHRCVSVRAGSDERCVISSPQRGYWYAGVRTARGSAGVAYRVTGSYWR